MSRLGWLIVVSCPLAVMGQTSAPIPESTPDTLVSIKADAESAWDSFNKEILKSGRRASAAEMTAAQDARRARLLILMDRALTLARSHPWESEGVAAAVWVVETTTAEEGDDFGERGDAAYRLLADAPALDDTVILPALFVADGLVLRCPEAEPFLRSVMSRSRNRDLATIARYGLGCYLAEAARTRDRLDAPISGPELTASLIKACLERCRAFDGPKLRSEAESLLEQVVREEGDEPKTLGGQAAGELYRIRHLRIGQPAPELVGEDMDGTPIRLGDFRGKVVVLSFWATWDYRSMSLIAKEKDLGAAMKGRPFALVGVNGDAAADRAKVKEVVAKKGITWRSFWSGGRDEAIPRKWGVQTWPTVYIIDADGTIRDDQAGEKLTPAAFQPLIQAAEKIAR